MPGQDSRQGRIYVGANQVRTDNQINGETIIQIIDMGQQQAIMINPAQKSFMRMKAQGGPAPQDQAGGGNPCAGMQNLACKEVGTDRFNGRPVRKYEISGAGQQGVLQVWVDEERSLPVRQIMPDGSGMEMRLVGREQRSGRKVEKWEMEGHGPDGQSQTSLQWYDPELKMNIREERPGGFVRELINIKPGKQPAELFSVPAGYSEIRPPQGG